MFDAIEKMKSEVMGHLIKEYKAVILPAKDEDDEEFDFDDGFSFRTADGKFGRAGNFTAAPVEKE